MALKINNQIDASSVMMQDETSAEVKMKEISNKLQKISFLANRSANPYALSADSTVAYVRYKVGQQYANMNVIATSVLIPDTPYNMINNITVSGVNTDGIIEVEFYGKGFVAAHNFVLNFLFFKS